MIIILSIFHFFMEQGCPHRSILPHIFPDCNSFAIKIGGKFCGVRDVCPGGGLPRRCRLGGRQRCPRGGRAGFVACLPCHCGARGGACPLCRLPTLPLALFSFPYPPDPLPGGKGVTIGYFMQGAAPLASPGLNPGDTGSPRRCGKLNGGGLASALPARRASAVPGGGRARFVAC